MDLLTSCSILALLLGSDFRAGERVPASRKVSKVLGYVPSERIVSNSQMCEFGKRSKGGDNLIPECAGHTPPVQHFLSKVPET